MTAADRRWALAAWWMWAAVAGTAIGLGLSLVFAHLGVAPWTLRVPQDPPVPQVVDPDPSPVVELDQPLDMSCTVEVIDGQTSVSCVA